MNQHIGATAFLCVYLFVYVVAVIGIGVWRIKRKQEKPPLELKLLNGPGESLRRKITKVDEELLFQFSGAAITPVVAGLVTFLLLVWLAPRLNPTFQFVIIGLIFVATLAASGRWLWQKILRLRNYQLGYLGERAVAEAMMPLIECGYRVFHDLPATIGDQVSNIDHVAVGANGVFAIETKTRRKGHTRPGLEAHKVIYDGKRLIWPWTEDTEHLEQAEFQAQWLTEWLHQMTGVKLVSQPVLVLPGWFVISQGPVGTVAVVNQQLLPSAITRAARLTLSPKEIDLVSRKLEECCREVVD